VDRHGSRATGAIIIPKKPTSVAAPSPRHFRSVLSEGGGLRVVVCGVVRVVRLCV